MDFDPKCRRCLYLTLLYQQMIACWQHASGVVRPESDDGPGSSETVGGVPLGLRPGDALASLLPHFEHTVLFRRDEYQRLRALRARVRAMLAQGVHPDELVSPDER